MELVYVSDSKSEFCEFESRHPHQAEIAQLVERQIENLRVGGSIPSLGTSYGGIAQVA